MTWMQTSLIKSVLSLDTKELDLKNTLEGRDVHRLLWTQQPLQYMSMALDLVHNWASIVSASYLPSKIAVGGGMKEQSSPRAEVGILRNKHGNTCEIQDAEPARVIPASSPRVRAGEEEGGRRGAQRRARRPGRLTRQHPADSPGVEGELCRPQEPTRSRPLQGTLLFFL